MMSLSCLIIGGAGFMGSHLTDALVARGHRVRIFDRPNVDLKNLSQSRQKIQVAAGDFSNDIDIIDALRDIDVVVHLASTTLPKTSNENPAYDIETNVLPSVKLLSRLHESDVKKVVFASSGGTVYGTPQFQPISENHPTNPLCSYGIAKLAIEKYLFLFDYLCGIDHVVLRIANPYGERQDPRGSVGAIAVFLWQAMNRQPITIWGDGSVARDYFYIGDLVRAFVIAIETKLPSKVYNIGGQRCCTLNEIIDVLSVVTKNRPEVVYTPARKLDVPSNMLDTQLAREEMNWEPRVSLPEGIERTWTWLKAIP